ncbi:MAG: YraN family protein [Actinomycetota bacterium]
MDGRPILGRTGEDAAAAYFERLGWSVLERNFRCPTGEIDIVARDGDVVVFCEVKTRRTDRWGLPAEAVNRRKQARLRRLAGEWLGSRRPGRVDVRFDVVSVIVADNATEVTHLRDAF